MKDKKNTKMSISRLLLLLLLLFKKNMLVQLPTNVIWDLEWELVSDYRNLAQRQRGAVGDFVLSSLLLESIVVGVREQRTHPDVLVRQCAYLTASELMIELNQVSREGLINLRRASYCSAWRRTNTRKIRQTNKQTDSRASG